VEVDFSLVWDSDRVREYCAEMSRELLLLLRSRRLRAAAVASPQPSDPLDELINGRAGAGLGGVVEPAGPAAAAGGAVADGPPPPLSEMSVAGARARSLVIMRSHVTSAFMCCLRFSR
jgi:hypothetical protein